jgi:hypothetical protein
MILCSLCLVLASCGLKRSNPLDPTGNIGIVVPETVSNVACSPSPAGAANKYVNVSWNPNSLYSTDGYYVYRGLAYNSAYSVVDTVFTNSCSHGSKPWHMVTPGDYYYKVSAFKVYSAGRLEGRLSQPAFVRVPV